MTIFRTLMSTESKQLNSDGGLTSMVLKQRDLIRRFDRGGQNGIEPSWTKKTEVDSGKSAETIMTVFEE